MPRIKAIHWREFADVVRTRCGKSTRKVQWRDDPDDATCNTCRRLYEKDGINGRWTP